MGIQDGEGGSTYDMRIRRESCKSAPQRIGWRGGGEGEEERADGGSEDHCFDFWSKGTRFAG